MVVDCWVLVVGCWLSEGPMSRMRRSLAWAPALSMDNIPQFGAMRRCANARSMPDARCPMHDARLPVNGVPGGK